MPFLPPQPCQINQSGNHNYISIAPYVTRNYDTEGKSEQISHLNKCLCCRSNHVIIFFEGYVLPNAICFVCCVQINNQLLTLFSVSSINNVFSVVEKKHKFYCTQTMTYSIISKLLVMTMWYCYSGTPSVLMAAYPGDMG